MMFGYATNETPEVQLPMPIMLAHKMSKKLSDVAPLRADATTSGPDGKTQVTVRLRRRRASTVEIEKVLISTQHQDGGGVQAARGAVGRGRDADAGPADLYDPARLKDEFYVPTRPAGS